MQMNKSFFRPPCSSYNSVLDVKKNKNLFLKKLNSLYKESRCDRSRGGGFDPQPNIVYVQLNQSREPVLTLKLVVLEFFLKHEM